MAHRGQRFVHTLNQLVLQQEFEMRYELLSLQVMNDGLRAPLFIGVGSPEPKARLVFLNDKPQLRYVGTLYRAPMFDAWQHARLTRI